MNPQELLNRLEILSQHGGLTDEVLYLPNGYAQPGKNRVGVTCQDLRDFVASVRALQKPETTHES